MFLIEGYFDESGSFDEPPGIFCVSGYFIGTEAAQQMDNDWGRVLQNYKLDFFHMVDCAHGTEGFEHLSKDERIAVATELIALIKKYTVEGFSIFAKADAYEKADDSPDVYTECAMACVSALKYFLDHHRLSGDIAYFFENGHANKGHAYTQIAKLIKRDRDSLVFDAKQKIRLLQAADLLAWQSTKYAKDYFYPKKEGGTPKRPPRRDFASLMQHRHTFMYMHIKDGEKSMGVELWPLSQRSASTVGISIKEDGPIIYWLQDGSDLPVVAVDKTLGWRPGAARMVHIGMEGMKGKKFALCLDEPRLFEAVTTLIEATGAYEESNLVPLFSAEEIANEEGDGQAILRIKLKGAATIGIHLPVDVLQKLKQELSKS